MHNAHDPKVLPLRDGVSPSCVVLPSQGGGLLIDFLAERLPAVARELGIDVTVHVIGPRQTYLDHSGDWARASEIRDSGCLIVRPDHHVCWRAETLSATPKADILRVMRSILARCDGVA